MPRRKQSEQSVLGLTIELPKHISYSARDQLERCAKAYYLSRLAKAPSRPALWLAGGRAVHETTEAWDRDPKINLRDTWEEKWAEAIADLRKSDADESRWRQTRQGVNEWRRDGLTYCEAWTTWRKSSPWRVVILGGEPAIELDVSGKLPGCEVEIKAYLDRLMYDATAKTYYIVDLKTGTRKPTSAAQFGTYAALIKEKFGITVQWGAAFMNRKADIATPMFDLTKYTPEYVGLTYGRAWDQVKAGSFNAHQGEACFLCDVQESCYINGGHLSERFDPDDPRNRPPF